MSVVGSEDQNLQTPKWLEVLENKRNRPHKLAHEVGAGAPCNVCGEGCRGLHLHFWRKICIECKCRKEDHEIEDENDYAQFEILFGTKKMNKTTIKFNSQNKLFDWIPPNVPYDLVIDYLKSLPQAKLPISNTDGARYRKQQLEKQLPLHDIDVKMCHNLSENEIKEFEKYLDNIKNNVIGQGKILKFKKAEIYRESYIHNSLNEMIASSKEYGKLQPQPVELIGLSITSKHPVYQVSSQPLKTESYLIDNSCPNFTTHQYPPLKNVNDEHLQVLKIQPFKNQENSTPWIHSSKHENINIENPESFSTSNIGEGETNNKLSSFKNKYCPFLDKQNNNDKLQDNSCYSLKSTLNENSFNNSEKTPNTPNSEALNKQNSSVYQKKENPYQSELACGSFYNDPIQQFKELNISSNEVPQVPVQEIHNISRHKQPENIFEVEKSNNNSKQLHDVEENVTAICQECQGILSSEEIVIQTEHTEHHALWHAKCFICEICKELLVDLMYFFHKGKIYCGRHYADVLKIPRCYACDELIFVKEYTYTEGETYHIRHFCCFVCDKELVDSRYILKDNQPICLNCFQAKYGKECCTCFLPILPTEQRVSWNALDFHASPECFCCKGCLKSLLGKKFMVRNKSIYCSKECVN